MKRARYNEVPKDYRRDYKKDAVEFLKCIAVGFGLAMLISIMVFLA